MFLPHIVDAEVINQQAKLDGAPFMPPQTWGGGGFVITSGV